MADEKYFEINKRGVLIKYTGKETEVVIPAKINNTPVKTIGEFAFSKAIKKAIISEGVLKLESNAFSLCKSLQDIIIPETVTVIKEFAFSGCKKLKEVIIPKNVTEIKDQTFFGCENLEKITFPEN